MYPLPSRERRPGVAALTGVQEVGLDDRRLRVARLLDIVHAVAIGAAGHDRAVHWRALVAAQRRRLAVKIGEVGAQHVGREPVLLHHRGVGMAAAAHLR